MNYTLKITAAGQTKAANGNTRYIYEVSGSKVSMDMFRSDIETANADGTMHNGVISEKTGALLYFHSQEIPDMLPIKRVDSGQWYVDESLLKAMNWAAGKYPNLTPSMLLALIQGA